MGRLTDLVTLHRELSENLSDLDIKTAIDKKTAIFETIKLKNNSVEFASTEIDKIKIKYDNIIAGIEKITSDVHLFLNQLNDQIDALADQLSQSNKQQNLSAGSIRTFKNMRDRDIIPDYIAENVNNYAGCRYPGLILYPQTKSWVDILSASEPLYLVDLDKNSLLNTIQEYPTLYQNRLRLYQDLDTLPKNQFGVVFMWSFLNFLPLDKQFFYLEQIYDLLRPGGVIFFTYNNCDISTMSKLAEDNHICYSSSRRLTKFCKDLGYEIISDLNITVEHNLATSWMKVKKPGTLHSIKLHPPIGEIKFKEFNQVNCPEIFNRINHIMTREN
jgi:hypothetical protein